MPDDPVRRGLSIPSLVSLEYWIARSSRAMTVGGYGSDSIFKQQQTQLRDLAAGSARGLPEIPYPQSEGAGNAGRPMRPIAACAMIVVERTRVSQVTPESPGIPGAMVYGLFRALPGEPGFLATVASGIASANLTPASGRQDHTTSPSALALFVSSIFASTASRPALVTIAKRPSVWSGTVRDIDLIWVRWKRKYFCKWGWTAGSLICPSGNACDGFREELNPSYPLLVVSGNAGTTVGTAAHFSRNARISWSLSGLTR
jgi:hypothetical protein